MLILSISSAMVNILSGTYSTISAFMSLYDYLAIIVLMVLESASLPLPSEVILPLAGHFVRTGNLNMIIAIVASMVGTAIGISVDYWIAYFIEKDVVYRHLHTFRINRSSLEAFSGWFAKNGAFTVFVSRMLPVVRGLISFPAGFAKMNLKDFYLYSLIGALIWNTALIVFGYYALSITNIQVMFAVLALFAVVLYFVYKAGMKRIKG